MIKLLDLFLLATLFCIIHSRIFQTSFRFSLLGRNNGWIYLDKMTFGPGNITFTTQTLIKGIPLGRDGQIMIQAIPQSQWQQQQQKRCSGRTGMPLSPHRTRLDGQPTISTHTFFIDNYQIYYFVLKDCTSRHINDSNNYNLQMRVRLHLLNNGSEIGEQQDHWYIIPIIIIAGFYVVFYYFQKIRNSTQVSWSKMMIFGAMITEVSGLCWKTFGFLIYRFTGQDYLLFYVIYLGMHSISSMFTITFIVMMAFGWTLTFKTSEHFDIFLPFAFCLGIVDTIITVLTKIGNQHDKHHLFDTHCGTIVIIFRIIILVVYVCGVIRTYRNAKWSLKKFIRWYALPGMVYVISLPLITLMANSYLPARNRNEFVFVAIQTTKILVNIGLTYMINNENSYYNQVNYDNSSFIPEEMEKRF